MADDEKESGGGGEDSTFEVLDRDFQEVRKYHLISAVLFCSLRSFHTYCLHYMRM